MGRTKPSNDPVSLSMSVLNFFVVICFFENLMLQVLSPENLSIEVNLF